MLAEKLEQEYQLKNLLLGFPSDWFIDKKTFAKTKESLPQLVDFYQKDGVIDLDHLPLEDIIQEPLKDVYTLPLFSKEFCKILLDEIKNMQKYFDFSPNKDEDELRQIPEIVFNEKCPQLV